MINRVLSVSCILATGAYAATIHVPNDQPTIQAGIDAAVAGDVVQVEAGTYAEKLNFNGKAIEVRGAGRDLSVLNPSTASSGKARVVTFNSQEGRKSVLYGFKLTGGDARMGGGIFCDGSAPKITRCTITGNTAAWAGAGINCSFASPMIVKCTIADNDAGWAGGGINCSYASPVIEKCTIKDNLAFDDGGGIRCYNSGPRITNCIIANNAADRGGGGGMYCWDSSQPEVSNCTISANSADYGGGLCCYSSTPKIINCTIADNLARDLGGGLCSFDSDVRVKLVNCILWGDVPDEISVHKSRVDLNYSDVQGGYPGEGNIAEEPCFRSIGVYDYVLGQLSPGLNVGIGEEDGINWERWCDQLPDYCFQYSQLPDMGAYGGPGNVGWLP